MAPYGSKNSLSTFAGAFETVLGDDEINNNLVMYLDNLLVHSSTFSENLQRDARIGESDACKEEVYV